MSDHITGKVVVITGASSGLGAAAARRLAARGARLGRVSLGWLLADGSDGAFCGAAFGTDNQPPILPDAAGVAAHSPCREGGVA